MDKRPPDRKCPGCGALVECHKIYTESTHPEGRIMSTFGPQPEVKFRAIYTCPDCGTTFRAETCPEGFTGARG